MLLVVIFGFILLIGWKVSLINKDLINKKKAIKRFQKKIAKMEEKDVDDLHIEWKDQREGLGKSYPLSIHTITQALSIVISFKNI